MNQTQDDLTENRKGH